MTKSLEIQPPKSDEIEISLFGPGFGECIVIHLGNNKWIIIDSCYDRNSDVPEALTYFERLGIKPDVKLVCATHWHDDHIKGIEEIIKQFPNAKFVISSALNDEKFTNVVLGSPVSRLSRTNSKSQTGTRALQKAYDWIKNNHKNVIPAGMNQDLDAAPQEYCIRSLSPHSSITMKSTLQLIEHAIEDNPYLAEIPKIGSNDISVVLEITIGEENIILLGGDLEKSGWDLLIKNVINPKKAHVYKVSHHGGDSGDHQDIWQILLESNPVCLIAPFNRGDKLPNQKDVERLIKQSGDLYISSHKNESTKKYDDDKRVKKALKERHAIYEQTEYGQIQLRKSIVGGKWKTTLFGTARLLDEHLLKSA